MNNDNNNNNNNNNNDNKNNSYNLFHVYIFSSNMNTAKITFYTNTSLGFRAVPVVLDLASQRGVAAEEDEGEDAEYDEGLDDEQVERQLAELVEPSGDGGHDEIPKATAAETHR